MSKPRSVMPDLYSTDVAGSDVLLPPETMIVEARLQSPCPATTDIRPQSSSRFAISAGVVAFLLALAYVVSELFRN